MMGAVYDIGRRIDLAIYFLHQASRRSKNKDIGESTHGKTLGHTGKNVETKDLQIFFQQRTQGSWGLG